MPAWMKAATVAVRRKEDRNWRDLGLPQASDTGWMLRPSSETGYHARGKAERECGKVEGLAADTLRVRWVWKRGVGWSIRSPEQTNSQRQKVEWWSPGAGEKGIRELAIDGDSLSFARCGRMVVMVAQQGDCT